MSTGPSSGGTGTRLATGVLAPNPGPMTLEGTNTWLLAAPGSARVLVVDPGPAEPAHQRAVRDAARSRGADVVGVLLTHRHDDHTGGVPALVDLLARDGPAPWVRAADASWCRGRRGAVLADGDVVADAGVTVTVLATPGHTDDSVCLLLEGDGEAALLSGDTLLGRGSSVVAFPDGVLADYLRSLDRLARLVDARRGGTPLLLLPGHGPVRGDAAALARDYRAHRDERTAQVQDAVAAGARTAAEVVDRVYPGLGPGLRAAAERSVAATLQHLG